MHSDQLNDIVNKYNKTYHSRIKTKPFYLKRSTYTDFKNSKEDLKFRIGVNSNKLNDTVNKYNNTYHSRIKIKPDYVKCSKYIDFNKENNKEDPKFRIGVPVKTSKYKSVLQEVAFQIILEMFL